MAKLIFLGTSSAVPDQNHENTHFVLVGSQQVVLVDCVSNPVVRLGQAGVDHNSVTDIILTHFHPDHVSGVPLLLMDMWLLGREKSLNVYGLKPTLDSIKTLMGLYDWDHWPRFFPVNFIEVPDACQSPVLQGSDFKIVSSPVQHMIPTIGLRIEVIQDAHVVAYSCDTEPCEAVVHLAEGADLLIHEATGAGLGHSSAAQAGEIARQAEAGSLYLIHYPVVDFDPQPLTAEAAAKYPGSVKLAMDFMVLDL